MTDGTVHRRWRLTQDIFQGNHDWRPVSRAPSQKPPAAAGARPSPLGLDRRRVGGSGDHLRELGTKGAHVLFPLGGGRPLLPGAHLVRGKLQVPAGKGRTGVASLKGECE